MENVITWLRKTKWDRPQNKLKTFSIYNAKAFALTLRPPLKLSVYRAYLLSQKLTSPKIPPQHGVCWADKPYKTTELPHPFHQKGHPGLKNARGTNYLPTYRSRSEWTSSTRWRFAAMIIGVLLCVSRSFHLDRPLLPPLISRSDHFSVQPLFRFAIVATARSF